MGKFCSYCGKALEEGEVCTCQQSLGASEPMGAPQQGVDLNKEAAPQQGYNPNMGAASQQGYNPNMGAAPQQGYNPNMGGMPQQGCNPNMGGMPQQGYNPNMGAAPQQGYNPNMGGMPQNAMQPGQPSQAQVFLGEIKNSFLRIGRMFKDPVGEVKNIAEANTIFPAVTICALNSIVILILAIIAMVSVRVKLGEYAEWISLPYVQFVLAVTALSAIYNFGYAGALFFGTKVCFGENTTYQKMLAVVGGKVLLDVVFVVAGVILMLIVPVLGVIVLGCGMMLSATVMTVSFAEVSTLPSNKKIYAYFIASILVVIVFAVLYAIGYGSIAGAVEQLF